MQWYFSSGIALFPLPWVPETFLARFPVSVKSSVLAFGQHRKFPPHARKTSGTQGMFPWVVLINTTSNLNASVWPQMAETWWRFIWRFLRYQDSSTWPKWSSFIGFCCMNNEWAWEFYINNSESNISRQTISCVKTPEKVRLTIFHGLYSCRP